MVEKILVPLDGSPLGEHALPYAVALARAAGDGLLLLHAGSTLELADPSELGLVAAADRASSPGVPAETVVTRGYGAAEVARAICDTAREREVDLIVMSTRGRADLSRWVYGSVADQVLREADVPVLLVPQACERRWQDDGPRHILVPLDGSEPAEDALDPAAHLAEMLGAELILLRVVRPSGYALRTGLARPAATGRGADRDEASRYLAGVADTPRMAGRVTAVRVVVDADPASTIARVAREESVGLIAMATRGHGGLTRLVLGSVATGTAQRAHVPLLLLQHGACLFGSDPALPLPPEPHASGARGRPDRDGRRPR